MTYSTSVLNSYKAAPRLYLFIWLAHIGAKRQNRFGEQLQNENEVVAGENESTFCTYTNGHIRLVNAKCDRNPPHVLVIS